MSYLYRFNEKNNSNLTILKDPEPFYSQRKDKIIVWASANFSHKNWLLQLFEHFYEENSLEQYYCFARNLLDGKIFLFFEAIKKFYSKNHLKTLKINNLSPEVQRLVNKLKFKEIKTKFQLEKIWKNDPK